MFLTIKEQLLPKKGSFYVASQQKGNKNIYNNLKWRFD